MVAMVLFGLAWKCFIVAEAAYSAARARKPESSVPLPWFTYSVLVVVLIAATLIPPWHVIKEESGFAAFKIPSRSMCPTVCLGDRLVADMHAYRAQATQRGDLALLKHASSDAFFVKRVIGLPGDVLAPGPDGTILVNGQVFHPPAPCGTPTWTKDVPSDYSAFHSATVREGNYFVIGDNLPDSYDSRLPEFGPVTRDMLRGKPLYFYWSATPSRIGCSVR